jgi:uncharacterized circularly permuted ATP-grasp superfamily protein
MIRYYLGQEPLLKNVETYLCRRPEDLEFTLDNMANLVVKRVGESGGYGMIIGPHATQEERDDYAKVLRADPAGFIAQPVLALSRSPCLIEGKFEPRHVDLRPFVLTGRRTRIVPGAFCRVALRRGSLVVNSSQGGGGKDAGPASFPAPFAASLYGGAAWWSTAARAAEARTSGCWKTRNPRRNHPNPLPQREGTVRG